MALTDGAHGLLDVEASGGEPVEAVIPGDAAVGGQEFEVPVAVDGV
jgi:hypothetical protein